MLSPGEMGEMGEMGDFWIARGSGQLILAGQNNRRARAKDVKPLLDGLLSAGLPRRHVVILTWITLDFRFMRSKRSYWILCLMIGTR
jgi:predicted chitinase